MLIVVNLWAIKTRSRIERMILVMKKGLSLILCFVMLVSVFSTVAVAAPAVDANSVVEVIKTGFINDEVRFDIILKKNVSISGAIFQIRYDPDILQPVPDNNNNAFMVKDSYGDDALSINGNYASGESDVGVYAAAFVTMENYTSAYKKGFLTFKFKVKGQNYDSTDIKFYCVEFNSANPDYNIPKNETDPQNFYTYSGSTMNQIKLTNIHSVESGLRIYWEKTEGAVSYNVYKIANNRSIFLGNTTDLYFDDNTAQPNETTAYTVRALDINGNLDSGYAGTISGVYVPATSEITVSAISTGVKVNWQSVSGAGSYRVYRREIYSDNTKSDWTEVGRVSGSVTTLTDTKASFGKHYEYTVRTYTSTGASAVCRYASTWFYPAPTVTTTAVVGGVSLKWTAIDEADSYKIYRKYNGAAEWTLIATVDNDVTTYLDADAISGRNIDYAVQVCCDEAESSIVANRISYVGVPHLTSAANSVNSITVKWNVVQNASGYRVYRRASGEKSWTYLGTVKTNSYVDKAVKNGVYYKYTVRTVFYSLFSNFEDGILVKCVATPKLTSIANTSNGIKTTWNMVSGATGYRVYRRGAGQSTWTYLGTVTTNTFTDKNVVKNNYYRYTVRAVSGYYSGFDTNGLYIKRT